MHTFNAIITYPFESYRTELVQSRCESSPLRSDVDE